MHRENIGKSHKGGIVVQKNIAKNNWFFGDSRVRTLAYLALLVALEIVFNRLMSINTEALKIGFSFVPIVMTAVLFGPVHAAIVYALADTVGALMFPLGPYMPLISLSCFGMGIVYGLFLRKFMIGEEENFRSAKNFLRILAPILINCLVFGLVLNSLWLSLIYGKGFVYFFTMRIVEYSILIPVQIIVIPILIAFARRLRSAKIV